MSVATQKNQADPVRQFSIFLANKAGRLLELIRILHSRQVHVVALTILDTTDSSIVRMVVDDPDQARAIFHEQAVAHIEKLIAAKRYVLDSDWGQVQPKAAEQNAYLEKQISIKKKVDALKAASLGSREGLRENRKQQATELRSLLEHERARMLELKDAAKQEVAAKHDSVYMWHALGIVEP
jgi:hypothetical protein